MTTETLSTNTNQQQSPTYCPGCGKILGPFDGTVLTCACPDCARIEWGLAHLRREMTAVARDAIRELENDRRREDKGEAELCYHFSCRACESPFSIRCHTRLTPYNNETDLPVRLRRAMPHRCPVCGADMTQSGFLPLP